MKQKDILFILISSTFLVAVWIGFSLVHSSISSTISETLTQTIQPISGTFDTKTIQALKSRQQILPQTAIAISPTATPTPTPPPITPILPLQSSTPNATAGGATK